MTVLKEEFSGWGTLTEPELGIEEGQGPVEGRIAWEMIDPVFPGKEGIYRVENDALTERARQARKWLWERSEEHVVAVLHGDVGPPNPLIVFYMLMVENVQFLHHMTEDWFGFDNLSGTGWYNTEYRTFEFLPVSPKEPNPHFSIREAE